MPAGGGTQRFPCSSGPQPLVPRGPAGIGWKQTVLGICFPSCAGLCAMLRPRIHPPLRRGWPALVNGETRVVSIASWEPCQSGSPFAVTSMVRSSTRWTAGMLKLASRACIVTRAPASRPLVFPESQYNLHETQEVESYGMYTARVL